MGNVIHTIYSSMVYIALLFLIGSPEDEAHNKELNMVNASKKKNQDLRDAVKKAGLKWYEVAEHLGITPYWISRKLSNELPEDEKLEILTAIAELWTERNE